MKLFKRKKKKQFIVKLKHDQLVSMIKELLLTDSYYTIERFWDRVIILTDVNPLEVQEEVERWLNLPDRKEQRQTKLYCTCWENAIDDRGMRPVNSSCPIHGPISLIAKEGGEPT